MSTIKSYYFDVDDLNQNWDFEMLDFLIDTNQRMSKNLLELTTKELYSEHMDNTNLTEKGEKQH